MLNNIAEAPGQVVEAGGSLVGIRQAGDTLISPVRGNSTSSPLASQGRCAPPWWGKMPLSAPVDLLVVSDAVRGDAEGVFRSTPVVLCCR
jgi:hypothetical protein